jgi:hypothetical protein
MEKKESQLLKAVPKKKAFIIKPLLGDGANDLPMLIYGLRNCFHAKQEVRNLFQV